MQVEQHACIVFAYSAYSAAHLATAATFQDFLWLILTTYN